MFLLSIFAVFSVVISISGSVKYSDATHLPFSGPETKRERAREREKDTKRDRKRETEIDSDRGRRAQTQKDTAMISVQTLRREVREHISSHIAQTVQSEASCIFFFGLLESYCSLILADLYFYH